MYLAAFVISRTNKRNKQMAVRNERPYLEMILYIDCSIG